MAEEKTYVCLSCGSESKNEPGTCCGGERVEKKEEKKSGENRARGYSCCG